MSIPQQSTIQNKLLGLLPAADYNEVACDLSHILLPRGTYLAALGQPIEHIYFLTSGIGSVIVTTPEGHRTEAGLFGFDGYVPTSAMTGTELAPHDVTVQVDAEAYRMNYEAFRGWMNTNRNFARVMIRSVEAFAVQVAYTTACNALHGVDERLARWLLMCHDRVTGNEIHLTHEYISIMLAVRRPSVTTSLHILEGNGFIRSNRGSITIRDRRAMEEFAHDGYGRPEEEYRRLMKDLF
jgi:CRP-like cAMP-binding protein